jgi:putative transposase
MLASRMPWGLKRYQQSGDLHFITFSCRDRAPLLATPGAHDIFVSTLERTRIWYGFSIRGFVVMPEHMHLLLSEPERGTLALAMQMLKQVTSHQLGVPGTPFWEPRYYDFNVWSEYKVREKLDYVHLNPVKRGLVTLPDDWVWSSSRHYTTGEDCGVEIESQWTARRRELLGIHPTVRQLP